ncbi:FAD dependent oxidoreductase-domain-containing protein [Mycena maculata]|uniref:FAD dependent oxidoreductase-domain-containing protein n=1 Tax=Mycena maculata TaxID=230809 RepID=A0AAD7I8W8_9AGAR|nr:FAD dependent oxidoreductase-domain-containing protein [Mycena maculata]
MSRHCFLLLLFGAASALTVPSTLDSQAVFGAPSSPADLPHLNPTHSFWTHGSPDANPLAGTGSTGELTEAADVCIIGSGITGVSAAYHLANAVEHGTFPLPEGKETLRAVVLEARDFCSGATGRNGGNLTPYEFSGFRKAEALFGRAAALKYYAIEHYSATEMARIARAGGWADAVDLVEGGHMDVILTPERLHELEADFATALAAGKNVNVTWLDREEMNETYGTYNWGVRSPGYNLWPLKFAAELFNEANTTTAKLDLRLHTRTPVTRVAPLSSSLHSFSPRWELSTPRGTIACAYVLHATNAYASHLLPHLASAIVPVRGQVIALRAAAPLNSTVSWVGNAGYWFPRPAKEGEPPLVILGGAREAAGPPFETHTTDDSVVTAAVGEVLRGFLPALFPRLYEAGREPEREWTGIMGYTALEIPLVGHVLDPNARENASTYEGQYMSAGYAGHGMPRAYACAEAVVGMIAADARGGGEKWEAPPWFPPPFSTTRMQD